MPGKRPRPMQRVSSLSLIPDESSFFEGIGRSTLNNPNIVQNTDQHDSRRDRSPNIGQSIVATANLLSSSAVNTDQEMTTVAGESPQFGKNFRFSSSLQESYSTLQSHDCDLSSSPAQTYAHPNAYPAHSYPSHTFHGHAYLSHSYHHAHAYHPSQFYSQPCQHSPKLVCSDPPTPSASPLLYNSHEQEQIRSKRSSFVSPSPSPSSSLSSPLPSSLAPSPWRYGVEAEGESWVPPLTATVNNGGLEYLDVCNFCQASLDQHDIFMYGGEKAFCSQDCRQKEILRDERNAHCGNPGRRFPMVPSVTSEKPQGTTNDWGLLVGTAMAAS